MQIGAAGSNERSETEVAGVCRLEENIVGNHPAWIAEEDTMTGMVRLDLSG